MSPEVEAYRLLVADVYELAGLSRTRSEATARTHGHTAARWHVLSVLSEERLTVAAAARRLGLARQSVQRVVNDLLATGHLDAVPNPTDRRAPLVGVTDDGRDLLTRLFAESAQERRRMLSATGVGVAELETARATLRRLVEGLRDDTAS
ncbi:MarR family winged helix-turn-helix transcriptional regulator [Auraticoccus monumenti]|uniref:DNA-binding transcriptional regulator, MarR family n=1 Tax=Auraticoccus monumenti TaxID=675864 RepID=A0A1G6RNF8_9ACTN|nr:MarR family transcriptional regulator [Auraticoccus monumenti]SDD05961.1 DNA-binding transcriptional regulator, MarR family [Auraticoccus monumenti]